MIKFDDIKNNTDIKTCIESADKSLAALGFTEHSFPHVLKVANDAAYILKTIGTDEHTIELAKIAGYMHDIGNLVNRVDHSQSGAIMTFRILDKLNMPMPDICTIVTAIGNHDEGTGVPVDNISAALIIADKCDVRRSRVRNSSETSFDIHDRVNYSVTSSTLEIIGSDIILSLTIDTTISSVLEYFKIFIDRMLLCKNAAAKLGLNYRLNINGQFLL